MNKDQLLLEFAKSELDYAKHHENQRERFTSLILIVSAFSVAAVGWDKAIQAADAWIGGFLTLIGIFGVLSSLKHYAHFKMHYARFREYRRELDSTVGNAKILELKDNGDKHHAGKLRYKFTKWIRLHVLWAVLPALISIFGFAILGPVEIHCELMRAAAA